MKNKKKTIMLIIITISMVLLTWNKSYSYKMDDNEIEETEVERKEFGIYLQESGENYTETDKFPDTGYLLNTTKTECYEYRNNNKLTNAVEQSLTNGVIDGSIIVTSQKSMYCKIYFDKESTIPTVNTFGITGKDKDGNNLTNGYTYNKTLTYTFSWGDNDVVQYCLSNSNTSSGCSWIELDESTKTSKTFTISNSTYTNTEGLKAIYVYLKDKANNISSTTNNSTKSITVDQTAPVVKTLTLNGVGAQNETLNNGYTYAYQIPWSATWDDTDVDKACVANGTTCSPVGAVVKSGSITLPTGEGLKTVVIQLKDKAGNVSSAKTTKITVDRTPPVIKTLTLTGTNASPFVATNGYTHTTTVNYTSTITETNMEGYCIVDGNSCSSYTLIPAATVTSTVVIGATQGNHPITISMKDKAGNVGSKTQSIILDTQNPTITLSNGTATETSITVTVNASDSNGISGVTCTAVGNGTTVNGSYNGTNTCTFSGLKDGTIYSITGVATDGSGRKGTSNSISVTTKKVEFKGTAKELLSSQLRPKGLSTNLLGDMFRFVGTKGNVNNYICFGTTSKCSETDDYMYRIIGITQDGQMKLIKNTAIREGENYRYRWHKTETTNTTWPNSDIYKRLNGQGSGSAQGTSGNTNLFINSTTSNVQYIKTTDNTTWYNKIERNHEWLYGGIYYENIDKTADEIYKIESGHQAVQQNINEGATLWTSKIQAAVGLMYVSDYYYSYAGGGSDSSNTNCFSSTSCVHGWLHISQNGKNDDYQSDWTMVQYGYNSFSGYLAWFVLSYGNMYHYFLSDDLSVRPVFYLYSSVFISSGTGTSIDPFIIAA